MKKISKQTESTIVSAIEKTAELVNAGEHPNTAIVKSAQEFGVPPGNVNLMVHAYNTGRTTRQRHEGDTVWEKAADFELADPAVVLEMLYPDRVKSAAAIEQETVVSPDYGLSPTGLLARRQARQKASQTIDWKMVEKPPEPYPGDPAYQMKKASATVDRLKRDHDEQRRQTAAAMDKAAGTFDELSDYFRSPGCTPIPVVRENVMLLHGDVGTRVMDELVQLAPGLGKMAMHKVAAAKPLPAATGKPYELVSRLIDELGQYVKLNNNLVKTAAATQQQAEVLLGPFVPAANCSVLDNQSFTKEAFGGKPAAPKTSTFGKGLNTLGHASLLKSVLDFTANSMDPSRSPGQQKGLQSDVNGAAAALTDPDHEAELRKIDVQSMLQDLMLNDEVLSGFDPDDVAMAYNDVVQMAPRLANQKLPIQSLVRKRLTQGALDTFDVDQVYGMEGKVRSNREPYKDTTPRVPAGVGADGSVL